MFLEQARAAWRMEDPAAAQDAAVDAMRAEIGHRFVRWREFSWVLRYAPDPDDPVMTGDHSIGADGPAPTLVAAAGDPRTTLFVPLARDMCLFGAVVPLHPTTERFMPRDLERLRHFVHAQASEFVVSTLPLAFPRV
jgi:hypothetical protein